MVKHISVVLKEGILTPIYKMGDVTIGGGWTEGGGTGVMGAGAGIEGRWAGVKGAGGRRGAGIL